MNDFRKDLEDLLNSHGIDTECHTPDFILADIICKLLEALGHHHKERDIWFGRYNQEINES
jgi:hypothetical protein